MSKKTISITVDGHVEAKQLANDLVVAGVWFECEPEPDDFYSFTVKSEAKHLLPVKYTVGCGGDD